MKRLLIFAVAAFHILAALAQAPNTWTQKSDLGYSIPNKFLERKGAAAFVIGQKAYIGTGANATLKFNDFWEYDPATNIWTQKANFPGSARSEAAAFSINGTGYMGTGNAASGPTQDFYAYNPTTNSWLPRANFTGVARSGATGFSLNGKAYVGTGQAGSVFLSDFYEYDPVTDVWTAKAPFTGSPRSGAISFALSGKGYLGTGMIGVSGGSTNTFYEYNPVSNTWVQKANAGTVARSWCASFAINNKGYVAAGRTGTGLLDEVWEYSPLNNTWVQRQDVYRCEGAVGFSIGNIGFLATGKDNFNNYRDDVWSCNYNFNSNWEQKATIGNMGRMLAVGFSIGNKGYVGTGFNGTCKKDIWEFDPVTNSWSQKADLPGVARKGAVAFTIGNKGYVGMGQDDQFNYKDDFFEFDPVQNTWKQISSYLGGAAPVWSPGASHYKAVGFNIGNKGYVTTSNSDLREYDPVTDAWNFKGYFPILGKQEAAGFSIGNKGYIGTGSQSKTFYEYDPVTNVFTQKADFPSNGRSSAIAFSVGSKGYLGCGYNNSMQYADLYEYNPANNTWMNVANPLFGPRRDAAAFAIGNKGYVATGRANNLNYFLKTVWEYTSSDSFRDVGTMLLPGYTPSGCGLSTQERITVSVFNTGASTETSIPLGYSVNGVPVSTETFTGPVAPNASANYTFNAPVNLSAPGVYTIKVYSLVPSDIRTGNDTTKFVITNYKLSGLPNFDFQTPAADISRMRKASGSRSYVGPGLGSNFHPFTPTGRGVTYYTLGDTIDWVNASNPGDTWTINKSYFAGAYLCFSPAGGSSSDSLWLTFDLNQYYQVNPAYTNFRITVNGQQVSPTYNPQGPNHALNWKRYKVDLYQFRNDTIMEIGFESIVRDNTNSGFGGANLLDNIRVWRRLGGGLSDGENLQENSLQVYPNPANGFFTINLPAATTYDLTLTDLAGRIINRQTFSSGISQVKTQNIKPGVYLLKVSSGKGVIVRKLVIN